MRDPECRGGDLDRRVADVAGGGGHARLCHIDHDPHGRSILGPFGQPLERRDEPADLELDRVLGLASASTSRDTARSDAARCSGEPSRSASASACADGRHDLGVQVAGEP